MLIFDYILSSEVSIFFFSSSSILPNLIVSRFFLNRSISWIKNNLLLSFFLLALYYIPAALFFGYGTLGCMFIICGYLRRNDSKNLKSSLFLIFTTIFYIIFQGYLYSFWEITMFTTEMLILLYYMYNFKVKNYLISNHSLNYLILLCSRYSLYFYCIHFELFKIISIII